MSSEQSSMGGAKAAIFIAFILSAACLAGVGYVYQSLNSERRERIALEASSSDLEEQNQQLKAKNIEYEDEIERMREQLKMYSSEQANWKKEADAAKAEVEKYQRQAADLQKQIETPKPSMVNDLSGSTDNLPSGASSDSPQASDVPSPAAVPAESSGAASTEVPVSGKSKHVMTVNRKFNFVVVNIGMKDELKMGDKLNVERSGKVVGLLQVEKLYDQFAAATIVQEVKETPIQEGDAVVRMKV